MASTVKTVNRRPGRTIRIESRDRLTRTGIGCLLLMFTTAVYGQTGGAAAPPAGGGFVANVRDPNTTSQRVKVAKDRSVIIDTSLPCARVQAIGENVVGVDAVSPKQFIVTGKEYGVTQVIAWSESGERHVFEISVELDLQLLNATLADLDAQSDARAISVMGNIVLTGTTSGADVAQQMEDIANLFRSQLAPNAKVQNNLRVSGEQQVLLRCVVAEVSRTATRALGINGFLAGQNVRDAFVVNQIGGINPFDISPPADIDVTQPIPFLTGDNAFLSAPATLSLGFPRAQLQFFLRAMADNSLLRILAEPTLVAISGQSANFLAGGEFPIPVPQAGASSGSITIEYKEFGVNLEFTPLVLPNQRIRLKVRPEVSTRDDTRGITLSGFVVPSITTRRAETTVEMDSGSSIAIAGLLRDEVRGVATRIPGIGDLPVLGALFRSVEFQRSRTELVILVTPEIAASTAPMNMPELPGAYISDPQDLDLYLSGTLEGEATLDHVVVPENGGGTRSGRPAESGNASLQGPYGHAAYGEFIDDGVAEKPE